MKITKTHIVIMTICFIYAGVLPLPTYSYEPNNMEPVNDILNYWSNILDYVVDGDYIYTISGSSGIHVLNKSNPQQIEITANYKSLYYNNIVCQGDYLYLISIDKIVSINKSNPQNFVVCDSLLFDNRYSNRIIQDGSTIYVQVSDEIIFIDISDPENMTLSGEGYISDEDFEYSYLNMVVKDGYCYYINGDMTFKVLDLTNPPEITEINELTIEVENEPTFYRYPLMHIDEGNAYISYEGDLFVLDINDIEDISLIGNSASDVEYGMLYKYNDVLYSYNPYGMLRLFDVSDPSHPAMFGRYDVSDMLSDSPSNPKFHNDILYDVVDGFGFTILQIDSQDGPTISGHINHSNPLLDVEVIDNYALFRGRRESPVYNISDPTNCILMGKLSENPDYVTIHNNYIYTANSDGNYWRMDSVTVYEIIESDTINKLFEFPLDSLSYNYLDGIMANGDHLLLNRKNRLELYDLENQSQPPVMRNSFYKSRWTFEHYWFRNDYIFTIEDTSDFLDEHYFKVYEIQGSAIEEVASILPTVSGGYGHLTIHESTAYLGIDGGLLLVDISDPEDPRVTDTLQIHNLGSDIKFRDHYLFCLHQDSIKVYDISYVDHPELSAHIYNRYTRGYGINDTYTVMAGTVDGAIFTGPIETKVEEQIYSTVPCEFLITKVYPNPFNPELNVQVYFPYEADINLSMFNILGQKVANLAERRYPQGYHHFRFDGTHHSSGIYFIKATINGTMDIQQKVTLIK